MSDPLTGHLDLDALADLLAGDETHRAHVNQCGACSAALAELDQALPSVTSALARLPLPAAPADLERRLAQALRPRPVGDLQQHRTNRWSKPVVAVGGLAAAAALVLGGVVVLGGDDTGGRPTADSAAKGTEAATTRISSTGADYRKDGKLLAQELPALLAGRAQAFAAAAPAAPGTLSDRSGTGAGAFTAADPLARLRSTAGLASCITALTDPSDSSLPLAVDYASFEGQPALVVVLPGLKADRVDVFVVGATCSPSDAALLHFASLPKP
ncbi:MAG: hypothetical protein JWM40_23 [Frankiales bacterium]|nr:hypothetical protein [Frankiales bacterium]